MRLLLGMRILLLQSQNKLLLPLVDVSCSSIEGPANANGMGCVHTRETPLS